MAVKVMKRNGDIQVIPNAEFLPAFYFIPEKVLKKCGKDAMRLPRCPRKLLLSNKAIRYVSSDHFLEVIIDAYAYMIWPHMDIYPKMEIFSGDDPAWRYAHATPIWIEAMEENKVIPSAKELFHPSLWDEVWDFVEEWQMKDIFSWLVPETMEKHHMMDIIECAQEYRCFEDFDTKESRPKIDFYRKWYHSRTRFPQISLDSYIEDYANNHGTEWLPADESIDLERDILGKTAIEEFMATLSEKDRTILELRLKEHTMEEIAQQLGFKNHTGVLKRIQKIGKEYEQFFNNDIGF